jgi:hypothetical protein
MPTQFVFPLARGSVDELLAKTLVEKLDTFTKVIGAVDDKLGDHLTSATRAKTTQAQLKSLYERFKKQEEEGL